MAQLQFLSGLRDGDVQDLIEDFGLTLGAAPDAYISVKDQGVESKHAILYSVGKQFFAKPESVAAKVFVNMRPLPLEGQAINDKDILIFGRAVIVKFWRGSAQSMSGATTASTTLEARARARADLLQELLNTTCPTTRAKTKLFSFRLEPSFVEQLRNVGPDATTALRRLVRVGLRVVALSEELEAM